jgi:hypothetical protein
MLKLSIRSVRPEIRRLKQFTVQQPQETEARRLSQQFQRQ